MACGDTTFADGKQVGYATSGVWSPTLKKYIAFGHLQPRYANPGSVVSIDLTIDRFRRPFDAKVTKLPFFNPDRKKETIDNHRYDAIVIGAGHNGLVNAAYLAKAGKKVLVLEQRHTVGGATVTEEIFPGFKYLIASYLISLLRPEVIHDLELARHGLEIMPLESTFVPLPDGNYLADWPDHEATKHEIERHSKRDAEAYSEYARTMRRLAVALRPLMSMIPPDPTSVTAKDLETMARVRGVLNGMVKEDFYLLTLDDDERG